MKDLTSGNIYKNFILFAIPMVLAGMLTQAYSTVDTIIAGKFIGDAALAAVVVSPR
jgi:Na+-driven multidrug efflux pump